MIRIEKNVPMPSAFRKDEIIKDLSGILSKMDIGDSIALKNDLLEFLPIAKKNFPKRVYRGRLCRTEKTTNNPFGAYRVWRVK